MNLLFYVVLFVHILLIVIWLGFDLVVFSLSMSLLDRGLSAAVRLDRAHLAEVYDRYVLYAFLLTTPTGLLLTWLRGWPLTATPWLSLKLVFYGLIIVMAIRILTGAAGTRQILQGLADGTGPAEELESRLRANVVGMAPYALALHASIAAIIFIALWRGIE